MGYLLSQHPSQGSVCFYSHCFSHLSSYIPISPFSSLSTRLWSDKHASYFFVDLENSSSFETKYYLHIDIKKMEMESYRLMCQRALRQVASGISYNITSTWEVHMHVLTTASSSLWGYGGKSPHILKLWRTRRRWLYTEVVPQELVNSSVAGCGWKRYLVI
jgi:hypothetical protein